MSSYSSITTIVIMAEALAKAGCSNISKLDINYFAKGDCYRGTLTLADSSRFYIYDTGAVSVIEEDNEDDFSK